MRFHTLVYIYIVELESMKQNINIDDIKADTILPTELGNFRMRVFVDEKGAEHSVLSVGLDDTTKSPLVRIHSECLTGDAFGSLKCDCGPQLKASMARIQEGAQATLVGRLRPYPCRWVCFH